MKAKKTALDARPFLDSVEVSRQVKEFQPSENIFCQGDTTGSFLYIQKGGVKLSVVNEVGRQKVVAVLGSGDFLGEGACLVNLFAWSRQLQ